MADLERKKERKKKKGTRRDLRFFLELIAFPARTLWLYLGYPARHAVVHTPPTPLANTMPKKRMMPKSRVSGRTMHMYVRKVEIWKLH